MYPSDTLWHQGDGPLGFYRNSFEYPDHRIGNVSRESVHVPFHDFGIRFFVHFGTVEHQVLVRGHELFSERLQSERVGKIPIVLRQCVNGSIPAGNGFFHRFTNVGPVF